MRDWLNKLDQVGSLSDCFRNFGVRLDECFLGAVHEFEADLQRRTAALHWVGFCVIFNGIHILVLMGIDRANIPFAPVGALESAVSGTGNV